MSSEIASMEISMDERSKRVPVIERLVDVKAIETRRLEKGLSRMRLCMEAKR